MSEADIPAYDNDSPDAVHRPDTAGSPDLPDASGEGWQTVNFPDAISLDAIDTQEVSAELTGRGGAGMSAAELVNLVHELRQHNHLLQIRVTQLETALTGSQQAFQAEVERSQQQEVLLSHRSQELTAAQEQANRLFQELESSHQAAQRQQILIETLTAQLESSQERIAQLERECALIQQRFNEQVQLLLQAENTCRDLRARLHRQQRQTLQFKAALEKCLEMPAVAQVYGNVETVSEAVGFVVPPKRNLKPLPIQIFIPKTQPVQPWSARTKFPVQSVKVSIDRQAEAYQVDEVAPSTEQPVRVSREWQILQALGAAAQIDAAVVEFTPVPSIRDLVSEQATGDDRAETENALHINDSYWNEGQASDRYSDPLEEISDEVAELRPDGKPQVPGVANLTTDLALDASNQALLDQLPLLAPELERQIDRIVQSFMAEPGTTDDTLWEDLANLIGLPLELQDATAESETAVEAIDVASLIDAAEDISVEDTSVAEDEAISPLTLLEHLTDASLESATESELQPEFEPFAAEEFDEIGSTTADYRMGEVINLFQSLRQSEQSSIDPLPAPESIEREPAPVSSRFFTLAEKFAVEERRSPAIVAESETETEAAVAFHSSGPSPVVYPLRPTKKLKSLAAVDLPSFPRLAR